MNLEESEQDRLERMLHHGEIQAALFLARRLITSGEEWAQPYYDSAMEQLKMKSKPDWIIILAIQPKSGRWLMVYHHERGWELPGGRIEDSESVEVAAFEGIERRG